MGSSIVVNKVCKQYEIGRLREGTMLREALVRLAKHPFQSLREQKDSIWALRDVSFEVRRGEVVGIVGRNGAGKSTLLKILTRITYPSSGSVDMRGRVGSLLEVGTGFHEELTGRENIYLNGSILGMKKREIDTKLDQIVDFAGVPKFIDTPIKFYSSGMRLRLGFAVAAHLDTEVLLVDEVLAVGDAEFQKRCLKKMENLHESGRTVLFVSHNTGAIESLCPRTIWIDQGRIRYDGNTRKAIRDYLDHFMGSQRAGAELAQIRDREGTGEVRFTGIEFLGPRGETGPVIRSGDKLTIRLNYCARESVKDAQFAIGLRTEWGVAVARLSTAREGVSIPSLARGDGSCEVTCETVNLMPGRYAVTLWITGPHHFNSARYCWDVLENCASLYVDPPDFYDSSNVTRECGVVLFRSRWSIQAGEFTNSPSRGIQ